LDDQTARLARKRADRGAGEREVAARTGQPDHAFAVVRVRRGPMEVRRAERESERAGSRDGDTAARLRGNGDVVARLAEVGAAVAGRGDDEHTLARGVVD